MMNNRIKSSEILFVSKLTKLEFLQKKINKSIETLIKKYKNKQIYKSYIEEYFGHFKTLDKLKKNFTDSQFIKITELKKNMTKNFSLIVSIGGDETFKYVLHHSYLQKFFLSIRSFKESVGKLSSYDFNQIKKLSLDLLHNNYRIVSWQCFELKITDLLKKKHYKSWGMDTIYIGDQLSTNISKYFIYHKNKEFHKSSGILVATGIGSMGWYRAASKGIYFTDISENLYFIVREIYQDEKKKDIKQGTIFKNESLKIKSLMDKKGIVNIDSIKEKTFLRGKILKIFPSKKRKIQILVSK